MKRVLLLLTLVAAVLLACSGVVLAQTTSAPASTQEPPKGAKGVIPDNYIVVLNDNADPDTVAARHQRDHGAEVGHVYKNALKGYAGKIPSSQLDKVKADPDVEGVSKDHEVGALQAGSSKQATTTQSPAKKGTTAQDIVKAATGESSFGNQPTGVRRIEALTQDSATPPNTMVHQASDANVAVIDTGIQMSTPHPDLNGNVANGTNCVRPNRSAEDDNGHGTHVSGTIAANNNGSGVEGVAPGTKLYAVKVLNSRGSGTESQVICGIDWVTGHAKDLNIKVANMSLGGWLQDVPDDGQCGTTSAGWDPEHQAICNATSGNPYAKDANGNPAPTPGAGVTFVVAAGNDTWALEDSTWLEAPGGYDEVLTVAALSDSDGKSGGSGGPPSCRTSETDDKYASFSNWATGPVNNSDRKTDDTKHTIAGPGVCIKSTWKGGGYSTISGTSMATPHLTGTVALCLGNGGTNVPPCDGLTTKQIIDKMLSDAQNHSSSTSGYGFSGDWSSSPVYDPRSPNVRRYFGYLTWDGGY